MPKYFVKYGCYLEEAYTVIEADCIEQAESDAYTMAQELTASWVGMHGFCEFDEEDEEMYSDLELSYMEDEEIENALFYDVEEYYPDIHDIYLT